MLELYFSKPTTLRQLRRGPLTPMLDQWAAALHQRGYTKETASHMLTDAGAFNRYLHRLSVTDITTVDEGVVQQFLDTECYPYGMYQSSAFTFRTFLAYLREQAIIAVLPTPPTTDPDALLVERYATFLRTVRGVASSTLKTRVLWATRFLAFCREHDTALDLSGLTAQNVLDFITHRPMHMARQGVRQFLRFLRWEGIITQELERVVMMPRQYALASVPRHLPWSLVEQLLAGVDLDHPHGRRDRAILYLLAYLGMRASEVMRLTFADLDWRAGVLTIPTTKMHRGRILPLTHGVGDVLADYILHERPAVNIPEVFVRGHAPYGPFAGSQSVSQVVQRHLHRLGIAAPTYGAHLLRHSFATHLVNQGTSIKDVADLLGHTSINTTAIYTKVDTTHLLAAALPFPTGGLA